MEDDLVDSAAVRAFVGGGDGVPDATTTLSFRHLLKLSVVLEVYFRVRIVGSVKTDGLEFLSQS